MAIPIPKVVDRGFVRFMMMKRITTGIFCLLGGLGCIGFLATNTAHLHGKQWALLGALLAICFIGGPWMIRDGLRLRTLLRTQ